MPSSVVEEYLRALHYMTRDGLPTRPARLAERLGVTPPTVTVTLQRMERDGLIVTGPNKEILLTPRGEALAATLDRRHALAERLLTDLLHMPWHEAHEESHGIEHSMSPRLEARLLAVLGNPATCPHGNPIPGLAAVAADEFPLHQAAVGETVVLERITEVAEGDHELLRFLQTNGLVPHTHLRVLRHEPFNGVLVLDGPHGETVLGLDAAAKIRARRLP
jgi:DtxR family transcriptional regulator, Mn-dependent transcriptional regulator